jgi:long-chain acyl-CoA synthetase
VAHIVVGEERIESKELNERIARATSGFRSLGVGLGDGVAMCLRNDVEFLEVSLGAGALGGYAIPINWHFSADEIAYVLTDSGAKALVIHADLLPNVRDVLPSGVTVLGVPTSPAIRSAYGLTEEAGTVPPDVVNWSSWLEEWEPATEAATEMPLAIFYTSGTTGRPKGVQRPPFGPAQLAAFQRMTAIDYGLDVFDDPSEITTAVVGPVYHAAPNAHAITSYRAGAKVVIMPRFDAEGLLRLVETERITHLHMVPVMFNRLLKLPESTRRKYDLSSLRFVSHAAAPCAPDVKRAMIDWWGPIINEYYGATEVGNVTFCTTEEWLAHPGTVGKPIDGAEVLILDDRGEPLGPNEIGEIACRYEGMDNFTYHRDPDKRSSVDRGGLTAPGDVGYLDEGGFLFICDRKVDMVISGGVNIYPAEIEATLALMPGVADAAVFGVPDDEFGEAVCAFIRPLPECNLDTESVQNYLRERIAGYKVPRQIHFRDELPREDSGKIFKRKLREPFWAHAGRAI